MEGTDRDRAEGSWSLLMRLPTLSDVREQQAPRWALGPLPEQGSGPVFPEFLRSDSTRAGQSSAPLTTAPSAGARDGGIYSGGTFHRNSAGAWTGRKPETVSGDLGHGGLKRGLLGSPLFLPPALCPWRIFSRPSPRCVPPAYFPQSRGATVPLLSQSKVKEGQRPGLLGDQGSLEIREFRRSPESRTCSCASRCRQTPEEYV